MKRWNMDQVRGRLAEPVADYLSFDETVDDVLGNLNGGTAFAYLFRRFGYPWVGWDDHKDLASYTLTTPIDTIVLRLRLGHSGDNYPSLRCLVLCPCPRPHRIDPNPDEEAAVRKALSDLLRPVYVRDVPINIHGPYEGSMRPVPHAKAAGYPSGALGEIDPEVMGDLHAAILRLGKGNPKRGLKKALALVRQAAPPKQPTR